MPEQAIEEAKLTKEMLEKETGELTRSSPTAAPRAPGVPGRRSAATSTSSAASWAPRSRPCEAASTS